MPCFGMGRRSQGERLKSCGSVGVEKAGASHSWKLAVEGEMLYGCGVWVYILLLSGLSSLTMGLFGKVLFLRLCELLWAY